MVAMAFHGTHAFLPSTAFRPAFFTTSSSSRSSALSYQVMEQRKEAANQTSFLDMQDAVVSLQEAQQDFLGMRQAESEDDAARSLMRVVLPQSSTAIGNEFDKDDALALEVIRCLDETLQEWDSEEKFLRMIHEGDQSVRFINARRFEVFVENQKCSTNAFDWVAAKVANSINQWHTDQRWMLTAESVKEILLHYARKQAHLADPQHVEDDYQYHNFAILINYGFNVPQQVPHIDLVHPNAQFGLMISEDSPGTIWYDPVTPIQSPRDLQQAWQHHYGHSNDDWVSVLEQDANCCYRLRRYGNVLSPELKKYETPLLKAGTLLSLPGGVVHAGPSCNAFRAVLFFSGYPAPNTAKGEVAPYDPDVQYFDSILLSDIIAKSWNQLSFENRYFLLERVVEYLARAPADNRCMHKHLHKGYSMRELAEYIELNVLVANDDDHRNRNILASPNVQHYLYEFASQESLVYR